MRAFLRSYRLTVVIVAVFVSLLVNIWVQDGTFAFLVVLAACLGCMVVVGSVGWLTGAQVVKHSRREADAIQSGNHPMKELTR